MRRPFTVITLCTGILVLLLLPLSCNKPRRVKSEHAVKPKQGRQQHKPDGGAISEELPGATVDIHAEMAGVDFELAGETTAAPPRKKPKKKKLSPLMEKLKKLKFKARREVVWARTTVSNIPSYQRSLEKFEHEFEQWKMYERIPLAPEEDKLKKEFMELAKKHEMEITYFKLKEFPVKSREIPEIVHGDRAFDFKDSDLRGIIQITTRIKKKDPANIKKMFEETREMSRLVHMRRLGPAGREYLINGEAYYFKKEKYPVHVIEERILQTEMKQAGIEQSVEEVVKLDTIGYLQNTAMSYKEYNSSLPKLNEAMKLLSESKFKAARSEFFRRKTEEAMTASPIR